MTIAMFISFDSRRSRIVDLVDLGVDQPRRRLVHQQQRRPPHEQASQKKLAAVERLQPDGRLVVIDLQAHQFGAVFGVELRE